MALFLAPAVAAAGTYDVTFNADGYDGSLVLTTSGPVNAMGGQLVTSITGEVNTESVSIVGLGGFASNDNLLYAGNTAWVDSDGIAFTFSDIDLSLFGNTAGPTMKVTMPYANPSGWGGALLCTNPKCSVTGDHASPLANATLTAGVPEPAAWALMLTGFAGLGGALRLSRRRNHLALAQA